MRRDRTGLGQNLPALDFVLLGAAQQNADVVAGTGHFLGHEQTLDLMQKDYLYPSVGDRQSPDDWVDAGATSVEVVLEADELVDLALHQAGGGHPGPPGDDLGDVGLVDLLGQHALVRLDLVEAFPRGFEFGLLLGTELPGLRLLVTDVPDEEIKKAVVEDKLERVVVCLFDGETFSTFRQELRRGFR